MRALLQRVIRGSVTVEGQEVARIDKGLVILVGIAPGDTPEQAAWLAEKAATTPGILVVELRKGILFTSRRLM